MNPSDLPIDYEGAQELLELREFLHLLDERDALREILESPNADPRLWQRLGKVNDQIQYMRDTHKTFGLEGVHWQFPVRKESTARTERSGELVTPPEHAAQRLAMEQAKAVLEPYKHLFEDDLYWDSDWNEPRTMKNEHEVFDNRERLNDLHISLRNWRS